MTPLPVIANVYRVAIDWKESGTGQIAENVIHVLAPGSDAATVATKVDSANATGMNAGAVGTASAVTMHVTPLDGTSATFVHTVSGAHWAGEGAGDFVPQASPVLSFYTTKRGRSYRGRIFLPFLAEEFVSDGILSGSIPGDITTAWESWAATLAGEDVTHVVASYKHASAQAVTSYVCLPAIGTQRRRQTRVRYP